MSNSAGLGQRNTYLSTLNPYKDSDHKLWYSLDFHWKYPGEYETFGFGRRKYFIEDANGFRPIVQGDNEVPGDNDIFYHQNLPWYEPFRTSNPSGYFNGNKLLYTMTMTGPFVGTDGGGAGVSATYWSYSLQHDQTDTTIFIGKLNTPRHVLDGDIIILDVNNFKISTTQTIVD